MPPARGGCRIVHERGMWPASSIARSRTGLYSPTRLTSTLQDADTTTSGLACPLEVGQRAQLDPACRHPSEVFLHRGLLQNKRGHRSRCRRRPFLRLFRPLA